MSNGKRQDGVGPSSTLSVEASSGLLSNTLVGIPTSKPLGIPNSVLSGLPSTLPNGLPSSLFNGLTSSITSGLPNSIPVPTSNVSPSGRVHTHHFNETEFVTIFTGQATVSATVTSLTVATTISVTPTFHPTAIPTALAQSQAAETALLKKCIIIGSVLGGSTILLIIAIVIGYCIYKRRRERRIRRHLGFDPNDSPPLTSLAPLPPTSPGAPPGAGTHLSTGARNGIGIASTTGGMGVVAGGYPRERDRSSGGKESEESIGTFGSRPRVSGPILTRSSPPSSPPGSPPRSPPRPPRPDRAVQFAMVPAITIQPSTPAMTSPLRGSPERTMYGAIGGREPATPPQQQEMRAAHDGSPRYFPLTNTARTPLPQGSAAPRIPSLGRPSIGSRRIVSSLYSTDDLGLGNLMPGSGVESERMQTRASSGVFPEPGDDDEEEAPVEEETVRRR